MPELAEVEFYRRIWSAGLDQRVIGVELHGTKRIFRGVDTSDLQRKLTGAILEESFRHGKQMVFRFSGGWLGIHLGMTGELRAEAPGVAAEKHDHLVLHFPKRSLVFADQGFSDGSCSTLEPRSRPGGAAFLRHWTRMRSPWIG